MEDLRAARLYLESAGNLALLATRDEAVRAFVDQLLALGRDDFVNRLVGLGTLAVADLQ